MTVSIIIMEIADNVLMLLIPGAMEAGLGDFMFWWSLILSMLAAGAIAFPVLRLLISKGLGHAVVHMHHTEKLHSHSAGH